MITTNLKNTDFKRISKIVVQWTKKVYDSYKIKLNEHRASGELQDTMSYGARKDDNVLEGFLLLQNYWEFIEDGRQPGTFPPVDAIREWIREKNIIPRPFQLPSGRQVIPTENQLAFLIGRKIKEEGIVMDPLLTETIYENRDELFSAISKALRDDVIENLEIAFKP